MSSRPVLHFYQVKLNLSKMYWSCRTDTKSNSNTRGENSNSKEARVILLVHTTSSYAVLHFYQISLKYSKGYSCYRVEKKSNSNIRRRYNSKSKNAKVVILVHDKSCSTCLPSIIKIFQRVFHLQSRHEINA